MKELKIEIPEGYEIDKDKSTFEKIVFKPIHPKKIEWSDFGKVEGYYTAGAGILAYGNLEAHANNKNTWPSREEAEACLALSQLCQWRNKYNEGWFPNDTTSDKFAICRGLNNEIVNFSCVEGAYVLMFKSKEIRDKFREDFQELLEIAKPLL